MTTPVISGLPAPAAVAAPVAQPAAPVVTPPSDGPRPAFNPLDPSTVTPPPTNFAPIVAPVAQPAAPVVTPAVAAPVGQPAATAPAPAPADTTAEDSQWLNNLLSGNPAQPAAPVGQPAPAVQPPVAALGVAPVVPPQAQPTPVAAVTPTGLPDFVQPHAEFLPATTSAGLPQTPGAAPTAEAAEDTSELGQVKKMLEELQGQQSKTAAEQQFQTQVDEAIAALSVKYGSADPKILEEFDDIFQSFRAKFGEEFVGEQTRTTLELKQQIQGLTKQLEDLTKAQAPAAQETNVYRNAVAGAIPNYAGVVGSDYFKQLLVAPVDPHNPEYTYNHKLGNMYRSQQTQDIIQFFADVSAKISPAAAPNANVVVDAGSPVVTPVSQDSLTTDKLTDVLTKVMNGELKVSEADMLRLRQTHARLAKKSN